MSFSCFEFKIFMLVFNFWNHMGNLYFTILTVLRYTLQAFNNITIDKMHLCNKHDILKKIAF